MVSQATFPIDAMGPIPLPLARILGGLGLFLLGMGLMTETLRVLAGNRLRLVLLRFTRSPASGALVGALSTALLQSSSATTVATVGFVSAGLLGFEASLGIIFGANVGSTGLGWLVALLGIQLDLGRVMLPVVFVGATLRLLGSGRTAQVGLALAGFALLFVGIDALQDSLAGQGLLLDPTRFDAGSLAGRIQLVLLGLLATVITQSSGAGVATMLAAVTAGAIQLDQACAVVIGMDVGTTVTALLAAIGASLGARRTAAAHVGFNLFTATLAFLLLPVYLGVIRAGGVPAVSGEPPFLLTAFHTGFNLVGVALMLPFTHPFARLIRHLVRSRHERPAEALEELPQGSSPQHLDRVEQALGEIFGDLIAQLQRSLHDGDSDHARHPVVPLEVLQSDLDRIELTLDQVQIGSLAPLQGRRLIELLHALDHLQRLHERCEEEADRARTVGRAGWLRLERESLLATLEDLGPLVGRGRWLEARALTRELALRIGQRVTPFRGEVMEEQATGAVDAEQGTELLQAIRWLGRVSVHLRMICRHLGWSAPVAGP